MEKGKKTRKEKEKEGEKEEKVKEEEDEKKEKEEEEEGFGGGHTSSMKEVAQSSSPISVTMTGKRAATGDTVNSQQKRLLQGLKL